MTDTRSTTHDAKERAGGRFDVPRHSPGAWSSCALGAVTAVLAAAPTWVSHPPTGLDPSYWAAMHMAARLRLQFGPGLNQNYGPLGFAVLPVNYFTSTGWLAALVSLATSIAICALVLHASRRVLGLPASLVCTYVAAGCLRYVDNEEVLPLVVLVALLGVLASHDRARSRVVPVMTGAAGALLLLAKFNLGLAVVAIGVVVVWAAADRWRAVGTFLASFTGTLVVAWVLTGNALSHLPRWIYYSKEIASGHSTAFGLETGRGAEFRLLIPLVVVVGLGLWRATVGWTTPRRAAAAIAVAMFVFTQFKHGFVRHDEHALAVFGMMPALYLGLAAPRKWALGGFSALVVILLVATQYSFSGVLDPRPSVRASWSLVADLVSSGRRGAEIRAARQAQRDKYNLDPVTMAALRGRTVHVDPLQASVMWAYPELAWRPLPVFQSINAVTPVLDQLNADALTGPHGPERILREVLVGLDNRNPDFESPAANLAMLCNYRELTAGDRWQVLGRVPSRCGAAVPVGSVRAKAGDRVQVPAPPVGTPALLLARVHGVDASALSAAAALVYKTPETYMETDDGNRFRLVPETAGHPLFMAGPPELGLNPSFGFSRQIHSFRLTRRGPSFGSPGLGDVEVEFFRVPLLS